MTRFSPSAATLASITAMAGIAALGAFLLIGPGQAASLPTPAKSEARIAAPAPVVQAPAAAKASIVAVSTSEAREAPRAVRVVYPSPYGPR